jgi:hypothetical protein
MEDDEVFTVELALVTVREGLMLGNAATVVNLDPDCMLNSATLTRQINISFLMHLVAFFEVSASSALVEGGQVAMQCVTLTIPVAAAALGIEVAVTLSTEEGTGD